MYTSSVNGHSVYVLSLDMLGSLQPVVLVIMFSVSNMVHSSIFICNSTQSMAVNSTSSEINAEHISSISL